MKKLMMILVGAGVGALLLYLFDPDRGRSRRARLADQAAAEARDAAEAVKAKVEYQANVVKGMAHEIADPLRPHQPVDDDKLLSKVRSEAVGQFESGSDISVDISDGRVVITGSVDNDDAREELLKLIESVRGVQSIDDRTVVA